MTEYRQEHLDYDNLIDSIAQHPYKFGLETALQQKGASIQKSNGEYFLFYAPPDISNDVWSGDCAADVLLAYKALDDMKMPLENVESELVVFDVPDVYFGGATHYRAAIRGPLGTLTSLDHSNFYASLPTNYIKESEIISPSPDPKEQLIDAISLLQIRNYKEFVDGNKRFLITIQVRDESESQNVIVMRACVYQQDIASGLLENRIASAYSIPSDSIPTDELTREYVEQAFGFKTIQVGQDGDIRTEVFKGGVIKDEVVECYTNVLNSIIHGATKKR